MSHLRYLGPKLLQLDVRDLVAGWRFPPEFGSKVMVKAGHGRAVTWGLSCPEAMPSASRYKADIPSPALADRWLGCAPRGEQWKFTGRSQSIIRLRSEEHT